MRVYGFDEVPRHFRDLTGESFFNLPEWYNLLAERCFGHDLQTGMAAVGEGDIALAFARSPRDRILRSCTNLYTCDFAILGNRVSGECVRRLICEIASSSGTLDGLQFEGLDPSTGDFGNIIDGIRSAGFVVKPYIGWANWFEPTSGMAFEHYLSRRPSTLRNTWTRKSSSLQKNTTFEFRIAMRADDPNPLIAVYEHVREQSWKFAEPHPRFVPGLIALAARLGALRFGTLNVDGEPAAAQIWIVWSGRATIYKLVHVQRFDAISPGTLLTMEMIRNVLEEDRPREIDFGRGNDPYKNLWMSSRRERWGIEAANGRTARGCVHAVRIGAAQVRNRARMAWDSYFQHDRRVTSGEDVTKNFSEEMNLTG